MVEGLVIVVSILLAFAIDAAWDQQVERREEAEILADLRGEVEQNLETLERLAAGHQRMIDSSERLVTTAGADFQGMSLEELSPFFYALLYRVSVTPVDGALTGALNSGKLQYIQNDSIRNGLVAWRSLAEDAEEETEWLHEATLEIVEYTRGSGLLSVGTKGSGRGLSDAFLGDPREAGEFFARYAGDQAFIDLVSWKAGIHQEYVQELTVLRDILAGIAEELSDPSE